MHFKDLLPGDLILFKLNGELFHVAIFAPHPDKTSNIIDATSNKGVTRGTLEGLYHILLKCTHTGNLFGLYSNKLEMSVVRSKKLNGQEIVTQADFWRLRELTYDVGSLAKIVTATWAWPIPTSNKEIEKNIHMYWHYARRAQEPMLENPISPNMFTVFCSFFLTPIWNLPQGFINFFVRLINYLTENTKDIPSKGVNCVGFVLTTLAAVALKNQSTFDIDECEKKLGAIARVNPEHYSLIAVMCNTFEDPETFENKGVLEPQVLASKPFNKKVFAEEQAQDSAIKAQLAQPSQILAASNQATC